MPTAATIRSQVETALRDRIPSALTPPARTVRPVTPTGIHSVDDVLEGGLPVGTLTELVGGECSGRTSLALSFLAELTGAGKVCAWIDVSNSLNPEPAASPLRRCLEAQMAWLLSRCHSSVGSNSGRISSFVWLEWVSATSSVLKSLRYSRVEMKPPVGKRLQICRSLDGASM
jgi:RecA/RadA recombinase